MSPSPETYHQEIALNIGFLIRAHLRRHPAGEVFIAPLDVYLSEHNVYQPDIAFVADSRRSIVAEQGLEGAPNLVVEILSPGARKQDLGSKKKVNAHTGVEELWIIDPREKLVRVYRLADDADTPAATYGANTTFTSSLLPMLEVETAEIFRSARGR